MTGITALFEEWLAAERFCGLARDDGEIAERSVMACDLIRRIAAAPAVDLADFVRKTFVVLHGELQVGQCRVVPGDPCALPLPPRCGPLDDALFRGVLLDIARLVPALAPLIAPEET